MRKYIQNLQPVLVFKKILIKKLLPGMLTITLITAVISLIHLRYDIINIKMSAALPGYMGAALGLLLVFRNNSAYDKWWEARKEIGALVNTSRNIILTLNGILPPEDPTKKQISRLVMAYVYALKEHLRDGVKTKDLQDLSPEDLPKVEKADHKPVMIVNIMINKIELLYKENLLTGIQQYLMLEKANALIDILGKCERIRNTPIPMAYGFLLKFFINVYVVFLPLGLLNDLGLWCIPLVMILYYLLMSIVITAEEIEEPFGEDLNDISMDQIAAKIKTNINEIVLLD
jgi:putative membrane protein